MSLLRNLADGLRSLILKEHVSKELDEELDGFLEMAAEEKMRGGMTRTDALRAVRLERGSREATKEVVHAAGWESAVDTFIQDIHYGFRLLGKNPSFTAVVILTLALGIGANTVIFSVINSVLLRSLPFRDPARLVKVTFDDSGLGLVGLPFSVPELEDLRSRAGVFEDVCAIGDTSVNLTGAKQPERLELLVTSPNYFSMLGASPQIGRLFGPQDFALGFAEAIVISDSLWRRAYGGDPKVLGRSLRLDNDAYTIVGVLPPGFRHPGPTVARDVEVFSTAGFAANPAPKPARNVRFIPVAIARLKPGITLEQAEAKLDVMSAQVRKDFASDYPSGSTRTVRILPLQESLVGNARPTLLVLMGAVILVILIASVNIANLLLARAVGRQREMSTRLALGASRLRMVRQMLTESVFLSLIAGVVGIVTAEMVLHFFIRFVPFKIPRQSEISIDWVVLGFATLVSFCTGLVFGLAPAIQSAKADLIGSLREGARGSGYSVKTHRMRGLLIVSELALTVVLMIGAGLLLRTFWRLMQENSGFNSANIVVSSISLPEPNDPKVDPYLGIGRQAPFFRELLRRASTIPGVELAGMTSDLPGTPAANSINLSIEDLPADVSQKLTAELILVSPDYFRIIQTPLVRGRFFSENDQADGLPVAIVDETTARRYWPNKDAIGRRLSWDPNERNEKQPWVTVVGIVKNIKQDGLDINGVPHIYTSIYQNTRRDFSLLLRTPLAPSVLEAQIQREVQAIDPDLPIFNVRSMNEVMEGSLAPRRFSAELVGAFAVVALLLASVGIYGLLAYLVGQRTQEIGVRIALGADRGDILKLVLRQGALLAGSGVCVGLILAAVTAPTIAALLYGIRAIDPIVFLAVPLVLFAISIAASYLPARRAARVSPILALRER
jgi:predicted permease